VHHAAGELVSQAALVVFIEPAPEPGQQRAQVGAPR
jgi:hypothetical protein